MLTTYLYGNTLMLDLNLKVKNTKLLLEYTGN